MRMVLGLSLRLLVAMLVAVFMVRLSGQEVLTLPIEKHTDPLRDRMREAIIARPDNPMKVVELGTYNLTNHIYLEEFSVKILSRMETNYTVPITGARIVKLNHPTIESNVVARIVWKGRTNECVLERNP